jgi:hypothetical protein
VRDAHIATSSPTRMSCSTSPNLAELNVPTISTKSFCDEVSTQVQLIWPGLGRATRTTWPFSPRSTSTATPEMSSLAGSTATTHRKSPLLSLEITTSGRSWSKAAVQTSPGFTFLSVVKVGFTASPYWHIQIDRTTIILLDLYQATPSTTSICAKSHKRFSTRPEVPQGGTPSRRSGAGADVGFAHR